MIGAEADDSELNNLPTSRIATAQLHLQSQIDILNYDLVGLYERRNREMLTQKQDVELKEKKKKKDELENKLIKKKSDQKRAQKVRDKKKKKMKALLEENPELLTSLSVRNKAGRPRIEEEMPSLLETIVDRAC